MLESYTLLPIALTAAVVFAALVVRGMPSFGESLVAMSLIGLVLLIHSAAPMTSLAVLALFIVLLVCDRHDVIWRIYAAQSQRLNW